jgi:hypothetical protein
MAGCYPRVEVVVRLVLAIALVAGCSDYGLFGRKPDRNDPDADAPETPVDSDAPAETCALVPAEAGPSDAEPTCAALPYVDWDVQIEAVWAGPARLTPPIVLPLDGSGRPTIVVHSADGQVHFLDGATLAATDGPVVPYDDNALAAVRSAGGDQTLLAVATYEGVVLHELIGGTSARADGLPWYVGAALFDADGDGTPEIATDGALLAADGSELGRWDTIPYGLFTAPADVDRDAVPELFGSAGVVRLPDEVAPWRGLPDGGGYAMGAFAWSGAEVRALGTDGDHLFAAAPDGEVLWSWPDTPGSFGTGAPVAVGDLHGDGTPDLVALHDREVVALGWDGDLLWTVPDGGINGGVTLADLDADGAYEVVVATSAGLRILDGATGAVLTERADVTDVGYWGGPVVADVDGDGSAEILLVGGDSPVPDHLYVLGAAEGRWARTRPVWNQTGYDPAWIASDGTLVSWPDPASHAWRAQPASDGEMPDLQPEIVEICCDAAQVQVSARFLNRGPVTASAGATLRLHARTGSGWAEVASASINAQVGPGQGSPGVVLTVPIAAWGDVQALEVVAAGDECDEINDRVVLPAACAP